MSLSLRSLRHPFAAVKAAFRDATETALPPSASLVASCKMSNSNPVQHAAIKIQTSIAPTAGGNTIPDGWMFPQPYRGRKGFLPRPGSFAFSERKLPWRPWNRGSAANSPSGVAT
jgi:hypothetical protein